MSCLTIIGAGGHGKVAADIALCMGYIDISFLDDAWPEKIKNGIWDVRGRPGLSSGDMFCAIGDNVARAAFFERFDLHDLPILKHPSVIVSSNCEIGHGVLLVSGSIVNVGATIGQGVILNTACSIDHDCKVDDFTHISPGAHLAGNVSVGKRSWVGIGAVIREGIHIGDDVTIGAGSVVVADVEDGAKVYGVPARNIK